MPRIVPIVEGEGDVAAAPLLIRRILAHQQIRGWVVDRPIKAGGIGAVKKKLERLIGLAELRDGCQAILILLDLDDGCPKEAAGELMESIGQCFNRHPVAVVFAHREYEAWFLASVEDIAGTHGIPPETRFEGNPEKIRGAKEWLKHRFPKGLSYKETKHQALFSMKISIDTAMKRSRSFRKLCTSIEEITR